MNKKGFLKILLLGFVGIMAVIFFTNRSIAQIMNSQVMLQNRYAVPIGADDANPDAYLVDNFEYWNNVRNMGWQVFEPPYPVWGYGIGYAQLDCILDFEEGSRVLDAKRPFPVFLFNTPYQGFKMVKAAQYYDRGSDTGKNIPGSYSIFSIKMRMPFGIEHFQRPFAGVIFDTTNAKDITIKFIGREDGYTLTEDEPANSIDDGTAIVIRIGREFQDSTWHLIVKDLEEILDDYVKGEDITEIKAVIVGGNSFRADDIILTKPEKSILKNSGPHLFKIGPVYGQLYNIAQARWIMAEDTDLMIGAKVTADGFTLPGIYDQVNKIQYVLKDGNVDPNMVAANLGIFAYDKDGDLIDPNTPRTAADADLNWILTMGDSLSPLANMITQVPLNNSGALTQDETDELPPYLIQEDGTIIPNIQDPNNVGHYLADLANPMYALAVALGNSGYDFFPNAVKLTPSGGQVFEDMIVTCRVTDGISTDKETFPVSIVNYPVTNHPPVINDVYDRVFYVGDVGTYQIVATDPDLQDMGGLTYYASLNGLSNYQYGPWMDQIIDPCSGLIRFRPVSEGALECIVTVKDPRGMFAVCRFTIFCTNPGTWFNHPPVVLDDLESPQTIRAGQFFVADELEFLDPDGEKLYYSCNIGSVGENGIWTFQSHFPGYYLVQVTAYDIRGGFATTEFVLHVLPWWSL